MGKWTSKEMKELADRYQKLLRLTSYPVAVKMFSDEKELEEIMQKTSAKPVEKNLTICQLLGVPRFWNMPTGATQKNLSMCIPGATAMGFRSMPEDYPDGYVGAYFVNEDIARKTYATMPRFKDDQYIGMFCCPFSQMPVDPDVVLFYGYETQILRLIQGYLYNKGNALEWDCCGEAGGCADPIPGSLLKDKPMVALPCNGARLLGWPSDEMLVMGIPANCLEEILEGMEYTHRGFLRYPLPWQHLDWQIPPGLLSNVIHEGKGFFSPEELKKLRKSD